MCVHVVCSAGMMALMCTWCGMCMQCTVCEWMHECTVRMPCLNYIIWDSRVMFNLPIVV